MLLDGKGIFICFLLNGEGEEGVEGGEGVEGEENY
jgi:hypothetical protein